MENLLPTRPTDRPTIQPTNQPTNQLMDMRIHGEVTIAILEGIHGTEGLVGPSALHIFDTLYNGGTNVSETKFKKPLFYNMVRMYTVVLMLNTRHTYI